jgi:RNA polymerase sigma factor (sigma-70 family)
MQPERASDGVSIEPTDAALIERSLVEPNAFAGVFDRHFDAVHGYATRRLGRSLAEEIASETFILAFDGRATFDRTRTDARPWLFGIAANLMRRHWRAERRRLHALGRIESDGSTEPPREERADLVAALSSLPAREREALLLFALVDLSYDEIAEGLELPIGTVRSRLSRARARIRKRLDVIPEGVL